MFEKDFIKHNFSFFVILIFIIKKSKKEFRVCVNYKTFNELIIKNHNVSSLIRDILIHLYYVKIYNKFNIIVVFNDIHIYFDNKKKTAFIIKYDLFKYVIISFELCNVLIIFQIFINKILKKYLNNFYNVYFDNIFIYNNFEKKHIIYVKKILFKLKKTKFYLNIDKCEFHIIFIKYLNFIIITNDI